MPAGDQDSRCCKTAAIGLGAAAPAADAAVVAEVVGDWDAPL
jgi:hypothetical protein